jgi:3-(3-hydroxy-phenyl)propionate hydroxylase
MKQYDVLIVGCGPAGATLANLLRAKGYSVAIFDRDKEVFRVPRAMMLDSESCRIYQELGIEERLEKNDARHATRHQIVDSNRKHLLTLNYDLIEGEYGYPPMGMMIHQPGLERLLRDDFELGEGVDAFLGYEVTEVDGTGDVAKLQARNIDTDEISEFTGRYLIGADGGQSLCRAYIGAKRIDMNYSRKWIVIDITVHDDALWHSILPQGEYRCGPDAAIVYVKGFHNHLRFDCEVTEEIAKTFNEDDARKLISQYIDISSVEFQRIAPYNFYAGMPDAWRKGRVFVAGDAAHRTPPFTGQGLNMGVRDAANLAFKLDLVFRGLANDTLLNTYEEERWENCRQVIEQASDGGELISTTSKLDQFKRSCLFFLGRLFPKMIVKRASRTSHRFPYIAGFIGDHALSGHLMIQPHVMTNEGERVLLDTATGDGFVLLQTQGQSSEDTKDTAWFTDVLGGKTSVIGQDFKDADGKLSNFFAKNDVENILIRPDRYIFGAGESASALTSKLRKDALLSALWVE